MITCEVVWFLKKKKILFGDISVQAYTFQYLLLGSEAVLFFCTYYLHVILKILIQNKEIIFN